MLYYCHDVCIAQRVSHEEASIVKEFKSTIVSVGCIPLYELYQLTNLVLHSVSDSVEADIKSLTSTPSVVFVLQLTGALRCQTRFRHPEEHASKIAMTS